MTDIISFEITPPTTYRILLMSSSQKLAPLPPHPPNTLVYNLKNAIDNPLKTPQCPWYRQKVNALRDQGIVEWIFQQPRVLDILNLVVETVRERVERGFERLPSFSPPGAGLGHHHVVNNPDYDCIVYALCNGKQRSVAFIERLYVELIKIYSPAEKKVVIKRKHPHAMSKDWGKNYFLWQYYSLSKEKWLSFSEEESRRMEENFRKSVKGEKLDQVFYMDDTLALRFSDGVATRGQVRPAASGPPREQSSLSESGGTVGAGGPKGPITPREQSGLSVSGGLKGPKGTSGSPREQSGLSVSEGMSVSGGTGGTDSRGSPYRQYRPHSVGLPYDARGTEVSVHERETRSVSVFTSSTSSVPITGSGSSVSISGTPGSVPITRSGSSVNIPATGTVTAPGGSEFRNNRKHANTSNIPPPSTNPIPIRCIICRRGAGIVPYCQGQNGTRTYFLLGLEHHREEGHVLSSFGGFENPEDSRTPKETAIDEAMEESYGCFSTEAFLRTALMDASRHYTIRNSCFLVHLGTLSLTQRRAVVEEFYRGKAARRSNQRRTQLEMSTLVWVVGSELYQSLKVAKANGGKCQVKDQFLRIILQNLLTSKLDSKEFKHMCRVE